jgi:hypothetical protein
VVDRTDNDTNTGSQQTATPEPPDKPATFDFKLRLGSRESTAALAGRETGELVQLQPIDWEAFTGLTTDEEAREYQTDSELQSIIVELANHIATPEELAKEAHRQQQEVAAAAAAVAAAGVAPPPPMPAGFQMPVAPVLVPPPPPGVAEESVVVPQIIEQTQNPSTQTPVLAANAAPVVGEAGLSATPPAPPAPPTPPTGAPAVVVVEPAAAAAPVVTPAAVPITPAAVAPAPVMLISDAEMMAASAAPAPAAPAAPAPPLQLAKIERRPDAERPTKPVDFHALLGQAGLAPAAVKKRKKRHPFRMLFKLLVVLALLGAGAFYGKKYVLDKRWDADVKPFAEDVSQERDLVWKRSVEVVELRMKEYGPKLVTSVLGADVDNLEEQWRAMGLLEGELDLEAVGAYAASFRPVFYDPTDGVIYQLGALPKNLHELYLDDALAHALLDQHIGWADQLPTLSPSQQSALRALVDGDARAVALAVVDPSDSQLDDLNTDMQEIANDEASTVGPGISYPIDLIIGSGGPASPLFAPDVFLDMSSRTELLQEGAASDAAVFDGARGIDSSPISFGSDANAAGMMYWYYVLAGRLDDVAAWNAAVAWNGDETIFESSSAGKCVTAEISANDSAGQQILLGALSQWAAAGPVEATAVVTPVGDERVSVVSCDPGAVADTTAGEEAVRSFGFAREELQAVSDLDLRDDEDARACITNAIRGYGVHQMVIAGDPAAESAVGDIQKACADA